MDVCVCVGCLTQSVRAHVSVRVSVSQQSAMSDTKCQFQEEQSSFILFYFILFYFLLPFHTWSSRKTNHRHTDDDVKKSVSSYHCVSGCQAGR